MRRLCTLAMLASFLFPMILSAQDQVSLRAKIVQEAETFEKHASNSDQHENVMLHMQINSLLFGLRKAETQTGQLDLSTFRTITGSAPAVGESMQKPGAVGNDLWLILCSDLVKMLMATASSGAPGEVRSVADKCPSASGMLSPRPSEKKQNWPDITDPVRSFNNVNVGVDFRSYKVSGILTQLYSGNFDNVADDENTRDYISSLITAMNKHCAKEYEGRLGFNSDVAAVLDYSVYYFFKNSRKTIGQATGYNNLDATFRSFVSMFDYSSGRHINQGGLSDGEAIVRLHGCDGPTRKLYQNIFKIAHARREIPPDVPNNSFFRAQMSPGNQADLEFGDDQADMMRSVRKGCENSNPIMNKDVEGFCRCQALMIMYGKVSSQDMGRLAGHFTTDALEPLANRYPSYKRLRNNCYN